MGTESGRGERLVPLAVGALAACTVVGAAFFGNSYLDRPAEHVLAAPSQGHESLSDIAGLGTEAGDAERDDLIAYWESWRRARYVVKCMNDAGYEWHLDPDYPREGTSALASAIGVVPLATPSEDTAAANHEYVSSLAASRVDGYFQALYGESAADIGRLEETGAYPDHRDDFAEGGCKGASWDAIGSVWSLKDDLAPDLKRLRFEASQTAAFRGMVGKYKECAASRGAAVDDPGALEAGDFSADVVLAVSADCRPLWQRAILAGMDAQTPQFLEDHADVIAEHQARYADAVSSLTGSDEFRRYHAENAE